MSASSPPRPFAATFLRLTGGVLAAAALAAAGALSAFTGSFEERLAACGACHGETGHSSQPEVPSLGGQPAFYLTLQLYMFRERLRISEPMNALVAGLDDDTLHRMAERIAELPPPRPPAEPAEPARAGRALVLIREHRCGFCHNEDFSGEKNAPRLAAQREDYLAKALREYRDNIRRAYDSSMADAAQPLTDADIRDLAHFLARFRQTEARP
ncbi:MAG TPA: c-type cytochrome [candidate division Zixibacteria bacterium]|nr:c-type cytochrome [candidate division Zixibacteria bacterium]